MVMEESNLYCNLIQIEQNYLLKKKGFPIGG
jgi:hypothetical protein